MAFSGAVLNTIGKFGVMSFSPVLLNIAMIGTALFLAPQMDNPDLALAIGIFSWRLITVLIPNSIYETSWFTGETKMGVAG